MKFTIYGRLDGLNEYTSANRTNRFSGAKMKSKNEKIVHQAILENRLHSIQNYPVELKITWYEKNARRDLDNVSFATKFIQDALVREEILFDDSQKYIQKLTHQVLIDKDNPRIEVEIKELK